MDIKNRVAALGFFDGLHIGHAALIGHLHNVSRNTGLIPSVVTFSRLPQNILTFDEIIPLINSTEDKIGLIERMFGIKDIIILPFDKEMAETTYDEFIDSLVFNYNISHIVAGQNFRFGKNADGNSIILKDICEESGIGCDIIPNVNYNGVISSSTYIRKLLLSGDIESANLYLGHPHVLTDTVRTGKKVGSKIGIPTINMEFAPDVLIPLYGVYITRVYITDGTLAEKKEYSCGLTGVTNIGIRPTVSSRKNVTVETHIPDIDINLYGKEVRLEFYKYLRPEKKFKNTDELISQIKKDCKAAEKYFTNNLIVDY